MTAHSGNQSHNSSQATLYSTLRKRRHGHDTGAEYCDERVCLSVCLSLCVCLSFRDHRLNYTPDLREFLKLWLKLQEWTLTEDEKTGWSGQRGRLS